MIHLEQSRMVVLGANGMLGQVVCRYFRDKVRELVAFSGRFSPSDAGATARSLATSNPDIVINCAGAIKQRTSNDGDLYYANTLLPIELKALLPKETVLIHPSTDCVFSGRADAAYRSDQIADAKDVYGWSKFLGEEVLLSRPMTLVPRVSIIGPDIRPDGPGLLNWFLRQPQGSTLHGFTNHHWNGITTLEWCRQIERLLSSGEGLSHTVGKRLQLGTAEPICKHDLLVAFARVFAKRITIIPKAEGPTVFRVLSPDILCSPLNQQLSDLAAWIRDQS
jgi:dTDP-4-dehydrorhamnose reductase